MNLSAVKVVTRDVRGLAKFYSELTRWVGIGSDDYVEFAGPHSTLAICSERSIELFGARAAIGGCNRSVIFTFEVHDADAEYRRLASIVPGFVEGPTDRPWGDRTILFRDPDGNLINVCARNQGTQDVNRG